MPLGLVMVIHVGSLVVAVQGQEVLRVKEPFPPVAIKETEVSERLKLQIVSTLKYKGSE